MINILKEFFSYILNPTNTRNQLETSKFKSLFSLLILALVFNGLIISLRTLLINKGIIPELFMKSSNPLAGFLFYPLVVLIISPVIEELGFRLLFIPKRINLAISFSIVIYFISYLIFPFFLFEFNIYLIIPFIAFIVFIIVTINNSINEFLKSVIQRNFKVVFYISTLLYTSVHLLNFWIDKGHLIYLPLIFLPYLMLGLVFGYVRVKFGIKYSIFLHFIYNLLPLILSIFYLR